MKTKFFNIYLLANILISIIFLSCNKDDSSNSDDPDYSQEKGTFKDSRDGKIYQWVKIGTQIWMAENLAFKGANIQQITNSNEWADNSNYDGWSYYDNQESNGEIYGILYQWEAAKKACPPGWHLPTNEEWYKLENYLKDNGFSYNGIIGDEGVAKSLATSSNWRFSEIQGSVGNTDYADFRNKTGFSALPSGSRSNEGDFDTTTKCGDWWSNSESNIDLVYNRLLFYQSSIINVSEKSKSFGFAVRCIKD